MYISQCDVCGKQEKALKIKPVVDGNGYSPVFKDGGLAIPGHEGRVMQEWAENGGPEPCIDYGTCCSSPECRHQLSLRQVDQSLAHLFKTLPVEQHDNAKRAHDLVVKMLNAVEAERKMAVLEPQPQFS